MKNHRSKAGARKRRNRIAARKRKDLRRPYQSASRPDKRRARCNRKAERFNVDEGRGWIVVRAQSGRYGRCAAVLRSAGCPVFEARQEVRTIADGRTRVARLPIMRRLLFVGVDAPEQACLLAGLDYVEATLCRGDEVWIWADELAIQAAKPAVIPPVMMAQFADHLTGHLKGGEEVGEFVAALFEVGQMVRAADGPFASFNGTIDEVDRLRGRYKVDVSIFGRATPLELEERQLEAA